MPIRFDITPFAKQTSLFVETGTHWGEGVACAIAAGFERVLSIELEERYRKKVDYMFSGLVKADRVELVRGDCTKLMPDVIEALDALDMQATFWLDAHHPTALFPCLEAIAASLRCDHVIMIDDVRLMGKKHMPEVKAREVERRLYEINPTYSITYEMGVQPEDVIVARVL
jgi:predicted O-methyltransferase YrrM